MIDKVLQLDTQK